MRLQSVSRLDLWHGPVFTADHVPLAAENCGSGVYAIKASHRPRTDEAGALESPRFRLAHRPHHLGLGLGGVARAGGRARPRLQGPEGRGAETAPGGARPPGLWEPPGPRLADAAAGRPLPVPCETRVLGAAEGIAHPVPHELPGHRVAASSARRAALPYCRRAVETGRGAGPASAARAGRHAFDAARGPDVATRGTRRGARAGRNGAATALAAIQGRGARVPDVRSESSARVAAQGPGPLSPGHAPPVVLARCTPGDELLAALHAARCRVVGSSCFRSPSCSGRPGSSA